uniref:C-type lectin domain-containing protein n=1 Tax=Oryzias latipes TaxID=8090 RepID=H2L5U8_ORYLA
LYYLIRKNIIISIFILDFLSVVKTQLERISDLCKRCPEGWKRFGSSCYYKSTEKRDWTDSRSFCQSVGFDLVVVNSKEEQVGVFTLNPGSVCLLNGHHGNRNMNGNGWMDHH